MNQNKLYTISARVASYYENIIKNEKIFPLSDIVTNISFDNSNIQCKLSNSSLSFNIISGDLHNATLSLQLNIDKWDRDSYLLIPAAVYNGNRFVVRTTKYPPIAEESFEICKKPPVVITDVPHLSIKPIDKSIHLLTGDMATPCFGLYMPHSQKGFLVFTAQHAGVGDFGMHIYEKSNSLTLQIENPGVRPWKYAWEQGVITSNAPCDDVATDFVCGSKHVIPYTIVEFEASTLHDLFAKFYDHRTIIGESKVQHEIPFSAAFKLQETKQNIHHWRNEGYYALGGLTNKNMYSDWQAGWCGGMMITHALLCDGDELSKKRVVKMLDWLFSVGQSPCGLLYPVIWNGKSYGDGFRNPETNTWTMSRKNADVLYFLVKQLLAFKKTGINVKDKWEVGTMKLASAMHSIWDRHKQLGQYFDFNTGDLAVGGSCSAAIASAAFALVSHYFSNQKFLEAAIELANTNISNHLDIGLLNGGPGEILKCPDSESAFGLLESLVVLWEHTGNSDWLSFAQKTAAQCSTWCTSYDFNFPHSSMFNTLNIRTKGSVWANIQNKHAAPGICTLSGDSLFKLYRATEDIRALNLIRDISHNFMQYVSRPDRQIGNQLDGGVCERINLSDWEGKDNVGGNIFGSSSWCEAALALIYSEIPGIYVRPDDQFLCVFDNINSSFVDKGLLKVENTTSFEANVKIFIENRADMKKTLGALTLDRCRIVNVKPKSTTTILLET